MVGAEVPAAMAAVAITDITAGTVPGLETVVLAVTAAPVARA